MLPLKPNELTPAIRLPSTDSQLVSRVGITKGYFSQAMCEAGLLQMQVRRNLSVLKHQYDLQQARNPGCGFKVTEIGLDRTEGDRLPLPFRPG